MISKTVLFGMMGVTIVMLMVLTLHAQKSFARLMKHLTVKKGLEEGQLLLLGKHQVFHKIALNGGMDVMHVILQMINLLDALKMNVLKRSIQKLDA